MVTETNTTEQLPRVPLAMLRGACKEQKAIFKKEWPDGCEATIENVRRAQELGLDLEWGTRWFTASAEKAYQVAFASAQVEYREATATAWKAYQAEIATAWLAYQKVIIPAKKVYQTEIESAWLAYQKVVVPAWLTYEEATATAWLAAFLRIARGQVMTQTEQALGEMGDASECFTQFVDLYRQFLNAEDRYLLTGTGRAEQTRLAYQIEDALYMWRRTLRDYPGDMAYELKVAALNAVQEARRVPEPEPGTPLAPGVEA